MKLSFLGGADEVGASATLVEIAGHRILVDCGVRMKERGGATIPHLGQIADQGGIEAVVLTHSHIDHSGALPVIYQMYNVPMYLTPPTLSLISIMLLDALKIMELEMEAEGETPMYSINEVEKVIACARPIPFKKTLKLFDDDVRLTFYSAGHILGAAYVVLEGRGDGTVVISGDVSVTDQVTIRGMEITPKITPDVLVIESTYGGRLHSNREIEETRLVEQAASVVTKGGAMLFPSFAVGRAQEIILILSRAMEMGKMPKTPILVDGLVKHICRVYSSYPELVQPWLRKHIRQRGNPFFYDGGPTVAVMDPQKRKDYAKIRPAIIVSSSGMLSGGPSPFYAQELASDPKSFIGITGYQDEESPGRRLQEIAEKGQGELKFRESMVELKCGIGTYKLSAHADTTQLISIVKGFSPKKVLLVHGDHDARGEFAKALGRSGVEDVVQPGFGSEIVIEPAPHRRRKMDKTVHEEAAGVLQLEDLLELAQSLIAKDGAGRPYMVQEILTFWGYPPEAITEEEIKRVDSILKDHSSPFKMDAEKQFLYRIRVTGYGTVTCGKSLSNYGGIPGRWDENKTRNKIMEVLTKDAGIYRMSFRPFNNTVVLFAYFPKVIQERYSAALQKIQQESKWQIVLHPNIQHQAMQDAAIHAIPTSWPIAKAPSVYLTEQKVLVMVAMPNPPVEEIKESMVKFKQLTGFDLVVASSTNPPSTAKSETRPPSVSSSPASEARPPMSSPASVPSVASVQSAQGVAQPGKAMIQPGKAMIQPGKAMIQPGKAMIQPAKPVFPQENQPVKFVPQPAMPVKNAMPSVSSAAAMADSTVAAVQPVTTIQTPAIVRKGTKTAKQDGAPQTNEEVVQEKTKKGRKSKANGDKSTQSQEVPEALEEAVQEKTKKGRKSKASKKDAGEETLVAQTGEETLVATDSVESSSNETIGQRTDLEKNVKKSRKTKKKAEIAKEEDEATDSQAESLVQANPQTESPAVTPVPQPEVAKPKKKSGKAQPQEKKTIEWVEMPEMVPSEISMQITDIPNMIPMQKTSNVPNIPIQMADVSIPLEINTTYSLIKQDFQEGANHLPLKTGLKQDAEGFYIELAFISPQIGEQYQDIIRDLEKKTGWRIKIKPYADQHQIKTIAKNLIPAAWGICKEPSFFNEQQLVIVQVQNLPDQASAQPVIQEFTAATGFKLSISASGPIFASTGTMKKEASVPEKIPVQSIKIPGRLRNASLDPVKTEKLRLLYQALGKVPRPIEVKRIGDNSYLLIDGLRRLEVAKILGYDTIEAYVVN